MKPIVLINNLTDIDHFIHHFSPDEYRIVTTDITSHIHLQEILGIENWHLSSFIDANDIHEAQKITDRSIPSIITDMDEQLSAALRQNGKEPYTFFSAYLYIFKLHYLEYYCFFQAFSHLLQTSSSPKVMVYPKKMNHFFYTDREITELLRDLFPEYQMESIDVKRQTDEKPLMHQNSKIALMKKFFTKNPLWLWPKLKLKITGFKETLLALALKNRPSLLLFPELYDLTFLKQHRLHYTMIDWEMYRLFFAKKHPLTRPEINFSPFISDHPLDTIAASDMEKFFRQNIGHALEALSQIKTLLSHRKISLIAWGNPPIFGEKAFLFDFLLHQNIPIVGMQHGNCYGDQIRYGHFDSDFNRCDYYFTYGFTHEDLERGYERRKHRCRIIPTGTTRHKIATRTKIPIDILFPITIIKPILMGGVNRTPAAALWNAQHKILRYLDSLQNHHSCYVKPIRGANKRNSPFLIVKHTFEHLRFVDHLSLGEFLNHYLPKIVIIDLPSSPLIDVIGLDTEIFLLADPVNGYETVALEKLRKRVHYYDDIDHLIEGAQAFLEGRIKPKRNEEYIRHYLAQSDSETKILDSIDAIVKGTI